MARKTPRSKLGHKGALTLISAAAPATAPTAAGDGEPLEADVSHPSRWAVKIRATVPASPSTVSNGTLYIYDGNIWYKFKVLNSGSDIVVGDQGYLEIVADLGIAARVDFAGSAVSANIEVELCPLIETEI